MKQPRCAEWNIYLHEWLKFMANAGKYTSPMEHMGNHVYIWVCQNLVTVGNEQSFVYKGTSINLYYLNLGGGFKYFLFSPLLGEDSHFD